MTFLDIAVIKNRGRLFCCCWREKHVSKNIKTNFLFIRLIFELYDIHVDCSSIVGNNNSLL